MTTQAKIKIADIWIPANRRKLDPSWVATLQQDMASGNGHMVPIEVAEEARDGKPYRLIFGAHRLAAVTGNGADEIDAIVKDRKEVASEAQIRLREIAENIMRRQLSALDRAVDIADWRDIYDAAHDTGKPGRKRKPDEDEETSAKFALNFSEAAQQTLGISRRSVFNALKIATIPAPIRDRISLHAIADSQTDLLLLASETADRQSKVADLLLAKAPLANNVTEALAIIDSAPKPFAEPRWQKVATSFAKLKPTEQDHFFELNEAAIQRWLKGRAR